MATLSNSKIDSDKILVMDLFKNYWFRVPEYQRPYVWGQDEVLELLSDLSLALAERPHDEYFLGSFVFQSKEPNQDTGSRFSENDLLDGQQRMTTLLLIFAAIRDLSMSQEAKKTCQMCIFQEGNTYTDTPERTRVTYAIRQDVQEFVTEYVKGDGGTNRENEFETFAKKEKDIDLSIKQMSAAILTIRKYFKENTQTTPERFLKFLLGKVLLIYVSTQQLEDAFRLFTVLNDRGIPLRNSDILKSINLQALPKLDDRGKYAKLWEDAEDDMGDNFDRFLYFVRTIYVKDKAEHSLLKEYEDKIYHPTTFDQEKKEKRSLPALFSKGEETFKIVMRYVDHYNRLLCGETHDVLGNYRLDNLVAVMMNGLPATDWIPPALRYYDKFKSDRLLDFVVQLDNKYSSDWISQLSPSKRNDAMNSVLRTIDSASTANDVISSDCFGIAEEAFVRELDGPVYQQRFSRYIMLKLDYMCCNHDHRMSFELLSVEHILPQTPTDTSQWMKDFSQDDLRLWTNKIGNLVLITRRKNSSQGRLDYVEKKARYFQKCIDTCPNSLRVLNRYSVWTPAELKNNHAEILNMFWQHYNLQFETKSVDGGVITSANQTVVAKQR